MWGNENYYLLNNYHKENTILEESYITYNALKTLSILRNKTLYIFSTSLHSTRRDII